MYKRQVLHHLSTRARRETACAECCRLLTPGGRAVFYAWAQEQEPSAGAARALSRTDDAADGGYSGHRFPTQDVLVPFHVPLRCVDMRGDGEHAPRAGAGADLSAAVRVSVGAADDGDGAGAAAAREHGASYDAAKRSVVFQRYCHVYCRGELESLFEPLVRAGAVAVEQSWYDCGNWCAVVVRLPGGP